MKISSPSFLLLTDLESFGKHRELAQVVFVARYLSLNI